MEYSARQSLVADIRAKLLGSASITVADLTPQLADKPDELRHDLYAMYWREARSSSRTDLRRAVVNLMLGNLPDETPLIQGQLLKWLQDFEKGDYDPQALATLQRLPWSREGGPSIVRLIGIAEAREAIPRLERQAREGLVPDDPAVYHHATFAALLALARMGNAQALDAVIARVRGEKDIVVRATILFRDLAYTRRPPAFAALASYVHSTERLPQVKPTVPGTLEAAYATAILSKHIKGFPFIAEYPTDEQVAQARAWLATHKQFEQK